MDYQENRQKVIDWTKQQLTGYPLKDDLLNGNNPINLFKVGCLFGVVEKEQSEIEEVDSEIEGSSPDNSKPTIEAKSVKKLSRYMPTSSASFSFYVAGKEIELRIYHKAVGYKSEKFWSDEGKGSGSKNKGRLTESQQTWKKILLSENIDGDEVVCTPDGDKQYIVFDGKAKIDATWRPQEKGGYIVTISLSNKQIFKELGKNGRKLVQADLNKNQAESTIYEVELKCIFEKGEVENYPSMDRDLLSDEEKEIELRYKDNLVLAIGHGVGTNWKKILKEGWKYGQILCQVLKFQLFRLKPILMPILFALNIYKTIEILMLLIALKLLLRTIKNGVFIKKIMQIMSQMKILILQKK